MKILTKNLSGNIMKIINDIQLELHPLNVYFLLTTEEIVKYESAISKLNDHIGFTRGIFKFHVVSNDPDDEESFVENPEELKGFNMFVRILDFISEDYLYLVEQIDFDRPADLVEVVLQKFIVRVCRENVKRLKQYMDTMPSNDDLKLHRGMTESVIQRFKKAASLKIEGGVWQNVLSGGMPSQTLFSSPSSLQNRDDNATKEAVEFAKEKIGFQHMSDKEISHFIDELCEKNNFNSFNRFDYPKPYTKPQIQVEIVKRKKAKKTFKWDVDISVNGIKYSINFSGSLVRMLYISTLLREKLGFHLYRQELKNPRYNLPWTKLEDGKIKSVTLPWLRRVYNEVVVDQSITEEEDNDGNLKVIRIPKLRNFIYNEVEIPDQDINQAKSQVDKNIVNRLRDNIDGCLYYCLLHNSEDRTPYYFTRMSPDEIIVPRELQYLLDECSDPMGKKNKK